MRQAERTVRLTAAIGSHEYTRQLTSGAIPLPGYDVAFPEILPIIAAFRRMVRQLEFDICELAPTTYLVAREAGVEIIALPVFLTREFHFTNIVCAARSGIGKPMDLEGRRVGVRAYTVSTGVWARSLLRTEYDVDPNAITWIVDDEEHVESYTLPPNVIRAPRGKSVASMFLAGELDAAFTGPAGIGRSGPPRAGWDQADGNSSGRTHYPLFGNPADLERSYYRRTGIYPLHGLVAVKRAVADSNPDLGGLLQQAFEAAKQPFLDRLHGGTLETGPDFAHYSAMRSIVGADPLPYGIDANRPSIDALIDAAVDQHILRSRPAVEDLFIA